MAYDQLVSLETQTQMLLVITATRGMGPTATVALILFMKLAWLLSENYDKQCTAYFLTETTEDFTPCF